MPAPPDNQKAWATKMGLATAGREEAQQSPKRRPSRSAVLRPSAEEGA